ncbi:MAG: metal-dependent hydrolase, partial [Pirellulales bacterium]|nr:metal-dependent hydrolase [Pirellulales bacterium]
YLLIRFGGAWLLKKFTVHRGMLHSIPAAVIAAELAFLLASGETDARIYKAGGVFIGYMVHLLLDEFYSVKVSVRGVRIKKSLGTAIKVFGHQWLPNIATYTTVILLTMLVIQEPGWMQDYQKRQRNIRENAIAEEVLERNGLVAVPKGSWSSGKPHEFETGHFAEDVEEKAKEAHETIGSFLKKWR